MALERPERVEALIVQDAVAHDSGLGENWQPRRAFWADRKANESAISTNLLSLATTRTRHVGSDPNVALYPTWQAWLRRSQPRLLVLWGKYELSFDASEPEAYRADVSEAEVHVLDGGHFLLDTAADAAAELVRKFMHARARG